MMRRIPLLALALLGCQGRLEDDPPPPSTDPSIRVEQWAALPGAPAECGAPVSLEPWRAAPALSWSTCASGRAGCRALQVDWPSIDGREPFVVESRGTYARNGQTYLLYSRLFAGTPNDLHARALYTLQPLDGPAVFALRSEPGSPTSCGYRGAVGAFGLGARGLASSNGAHFMVSFPWDGAPRAARAYAVTRDDFALLPSGGLQQVTVNATGIFVETRSPDSIAVFDIAGGTVARSEVSAEYPLAVPDGALAVSIASPGLALVRSDGGFVLLTEPEPNRALTWATVDRARGNALVWVESTPDGAGTYANPTLWTSPYSTTAGLARRKVAVLEDATGGGGGGMVVNDGMALTLTGASATLTRLADGVGWKIAEVGQVVTEVIWVDADEVVVGVKDEGTPGSTTGMLRLRRESLGPPDLAPGI